MLTDVFLCIDWQLMGDIALLVALLFITLFAGIGLWTVLTKLGGMRDE